MNEPTEQERELRAQARYAFWRMSMWLAGFGTYDDIDQGVIEGRYVPGVKPEEQEGYSNGLS